VLEDVPTETSIGRTMCAEPARMSAAVLPNLFARERYR
jgi:hypothetical protein